MAKKVDPLKQKAKRQKLIAIVGGVVLVALLAFQLPRTMKMLKGPDATSSSSTTQASTTTPLAPPALDGGSSSLSSSDGDSGGAIDVSSDGVRDPSTPLPADSGQLVSFSRFKSKDPFREQVSDCGDAGCTSPTSASATTGGTSTGSPPASSGTGASAGTTSGSKPTPAPASPVTTAVISVNGKGESVAVGKAFPAADPVFVLVKLTQTEALISISGGSLESGSPSIRVRKGKSVTLQNTADGTRYVLKLVSVA
jgi:hypothetical protein